LGTCAGLIVLAKKVNNLSYKPLGLIDLEVQRNAYGRQRESFISDIIFNSNGISHQMEAVFIRAPKIISAGKDVDILAEHNSHPVVAKNDKIMVCTFHPELTDDTFIHEYFINHFLK